MPTITTNYRVTLPGAQDIFHLIPDAALEPEARNQRRAIRAERIQNSPTPEVVRGVQSILTTIDDVQDALVTASLATRFAVRALPQITPAAKLLATAADVLNVGNLLATKAGLGGSRKGDLYRYYGTQPGSYSARLRSTLRTGRIKPGFGELLQVLQTSDQLAGVGLQLGSLIGIPVELLSLAARGGTLEIPAQSLATLALAAPMLYASNPWIKLASLAGGYLLSLADPGKQTVLEIPVPRLLPIDEQTAATLETPTATIPTLTVLESAEQILDTAPLLDGLDDDLSAQDHYQLTMARVIALATVAPWYLAAQDGPFMREKFSWPVRRLSAPALDTKRTTGGTTIASSTPRALPIAGSPLEVSREQLTTIQLDGSKPLAFGWIWKHPEDPLAHQAAALAGETAATLATILEGPGSYEGPIWTEAAKEAGRIVEYGPQPKTA